MAKKEEEETIGAGLRTNGGHSRRRAKRKARAKKEKRRERTMRGQWKGKEAQAENGGKGEAPPAAEKKFLAA